MRLLSGPSAPSPHDLPNFAEALLDRYLSSPSVRDWLYSREPHLPANASALHYSFSYACVYDTPNSSSARPAVPFIDHGDFSVFQRIAGDFALGTLFNPKETHALALIRNSILLHSPDLSSRPIARHFAIDLRMPLEILEFAWMRDHSLIVACRRLHSSPLVPTKRRILSADLLFYQPRLPPDAHIPDLQPLLRMALGERPTLCENCCVEGVEACPCPLKHKVRVPPVNPHRPNTPFSPPPDRDVFGSAYDIPANGPVVDKALLHPWSAYSRRLFHLKQDGLFFSSHQIRLPSSDPICRAFSHPLHYSFLLGSKQDTALLISSYITSTGLGNHSIKSDARFAPSSFITATRSIDSTNSPASRSLPPEPTVQTIVDSDVEASPTSNDSVRNLSPSTITIFPSVQTSARASQTDLVSLNNKSTLSQSLPLLTPSIPQAASIRLQPDPQPDPNSDLGLSPDSDRDSMPDQVDSPIIVNSSSTFDDTDDADMQVKKFAAKYVQGNRCNKCKNGKVYPKKFNLMRHIKTKHLKMKPFKCQFCSKAFGYKCHKKRHMIKLHPTFR